MKSNIKLLLTTIIIILFSISKSQADSTYYLDFKYVLNQSEAGKKAQSFLKSRLDKGFKNIQQKEKKIQEEEKKIIQQKKLISADEYKQKVTELRKKVNDLQKERSSLLESVAKQRAKAKAELLKNLQPIMKDYMKEKQIKMVIDKKSILLGDSNLDITKDIMSKLNDKLKKIKLD